MHRFQYPLRSLLLLMIPAAVVTGFLAHWFRDVPRALQRSAFLDDVDGDVLERQFRLGVSGSEFSITRGASFGTAISTSGFWQHRFLGGLWGDQSVADPALDSFRLNVKAALREKGQRVIRERVAREDGRMVAFQITYGDGSYTGIIAVGYGEETEHEDFEPFRNLHIDIDEWIGHRQRPPRLHDPQWPSFFKNIDWEAVNE